MTEERQPPGTGPGRTDSEFDLLDAALAKVKERLDRQAQLDAEPVEAVATTDDEVRPDAKVNAAKENEEFIAKIIAEAEASEAVKQAELQTEHDSLETVTEVESDFFIGRSGGEPTEMSDAFQSVDQEVDLVAGNKYRKIKMLGRGGQGVVYLVEGKDPFAARQALKIFSDKGYKSVESFGKEMRRMMQVGSLIHHHPHDDLVDIGWFGKYAGTYAMLMQYINGFNLRQLTRVEVLESLKRHVTGANWRVLDDVVYFVNGSEQLALRPAIAVYIIERVLRGLESLHDRGIVHGDIKPSNIMLNASGSVKIIDVGSAFEIATPPAEYHITPAYVAPEFVADNVMSKQSDLASVGYLLIELLSGRPIIEEIQDPDQSTRTLGTPERENLLKAKENLPDRLVKILPPNVLKSRQLVDLCLGLIAPKVAERFPNAAKCIVDDSGTYAFNKELIFSNLGVCNFQVMRQWLADVKRSLES